MAKYEEPFEDVQKIFEDLINTYSINEFANIKILSDDRQKVVGKIVKANPLVQHLAGVDIVIVVNEEIFEQLEMEQQNLIAEELLAGISWDEDKERIILSKGDVNTYSGILSKYGYKQYEVLQESIRTLYAVKANEGADA